MHSILINFWNKIFFLLFKCYIEKYVNVIMSGSEDKKVAECLKAKNLFKKFTVDGCRNTSEAAGRENKYTKAVTMNSKEHE